MTPLHQKVPPIDLPRLLEGTSYTAHAILGKGAQGLVVDATHTALGKPVVVKVLHERYASDPRLVDRIRLEGQAFARLSSPHLVAVNDAGTLPDGRPFFVMEKLWGRTLREEVRARGPLPAPEAVALAKQILAGLAVLHRAGLVHRDVKPDNVFLCETPGGGPPLVKLLDLGIAKVAPTAFGSVVSAPAPTVSNVAIGTPRFLSPEQAVGNPVDPRTDLYSLGAVLFWMLAGRDPFAHHKAISDVLLAHVTEAPAAPSTFTSAPLPIALERAIAKALQKLPEQRFASADELSAVLSEVRFDGPCIAASGAGTVRMPPADDAITRRSPPVGGGTIKMVDPLGVHGAPPLARLAGALRVRLVRWSGRARRVLPSLSVLGVVAVSAALVTITLLLTARVAGLVR